MTITLIAAVARNGVIGRDNDLVWRDREDLQRFKRLTLGNVLVMGRRTYDSIGRPLLGRDTIVVTRQPDWSADGIRTAHSLEQALELAGDRDVYVAGGGEIYRLALPLADMLELTEIDQDLDGDVRFPAYDRDGWDLTATKHQAGYAWNSYTRRNGDQDPP